MNMGLQSARRKWGVIKDFLRDGRIYLDQSRTFAAETNAEAAAAKIMILAHSLEKGLCLPQTKLGFGASKALQLTALLKKFEGKISLCSRNTGLSSLVSFLEFHQRHHHQSEALTQVKVQVDDLLSRGETILGGAIPRHAAEYPPAQYTDFLSFLSTRHSVRDYADAFEAADDETLIAAVRDAGLTPSQCNRQASRIYIIRNRALIDQLLALQGGASGFTHKVPRLAVITNDTVFWDGIDQRNQCWVDGALFAMTFLLTLHGRRLAACPLNLAKSVADEDKIKVLAKIPASERTIMMVAIGRYPEIYRTAVSPRRPLEDYCIIRE